MPSSRTWIATLLFVLTATIAGCQRSPPKDYTISGHAFEHWTSEITQPEVPRRMKAVRALGTVGDIAPQVIPLIAECLDDPSVDVRREAVLTLLKLGPAAAPATERLVHMQQQDADLQLRDFATRTLARIRS